jgi:hypothetical protein
MGEIIVIIFKPKPDPGIAAATVAAILSLGTMHLLSITGIGTFVLLWVLYAIIASFFYFVSVFIAVLLLILFFFWEIPNNEKKENQLIDKWYLESTELISPDGKYSSSLYVDVQGSQFTWELNEGVRNEKIINRPTSVPPEMLPGGTKYYKKSVSALKGDKALVEISSTYSVNTPPKENQKTYPIVKVYEIQHCMQPNPYCKAIGQDVWVVVSGKILKPAAADLNYQEWISKH